MDFLFNADVTGTGTGATLQVYQMCNPDITTVDNYDDCEKLLVDTDGNGAVNDVPLDGVVTTSTDAIYDAVPGHFAFALVNVGAATGSLMVGCR